ncbi:hypothetical protein [Aquiflexum balticum]|nr:hypothetical protein [Aquiflexum balticum]
MHCKKRALLIEEHDFYHEVGSWGDWKWGSWFNELKDWKIEKLED